MPPAGYSYPMTKRCPWAGSDPQMQAYHDTE